MSIEDILQALDDECRAECQAIFQRAEQEAKQIIAKAQAEAEEIRRARLAKIKAEAESETTAMLYSARLKSKNEVIRAKEKVVGKALAEAAQRMENLRSREDYREILAGLIEEGLSRVRGKAVLHVDPADEKLAGEIMKEKGLEHEIRTDIQTSGGVVVADADERVRIVNTVEERLNRAREKLRMQVSAILFGEEVEAAAGGG